MFNRTKIFSQALAVAVFALTLNSCTKTIHDRRPRGTVTPESREYFGCRVNGEGFVSEASRNNVSGSCVYKAIYPDKDTRFFQIYSNKFASACETGTVGITLDSVQLEEGRTYELGSPGAGKNYGSYFYVSACNTDRVELYTSDKDDVRGKVTIKSIDLKKKVVTGTFYFTVLGENGEFFQITGGIFDRHFTEN